MNFSIMKFWPSWGRGGMALAMGLGLGLALRASPAQAGVYLYVVEQANNSVAVIKTSSNGLPNNVVATVPTGNVPIQARATPDQFQVWVTNLFDNTVTVIRTYDNTILTTFTVANLSFPGDFVFSPEGDKAYITSAGDNTIKVVNTYNHAVIASIPVGNFPVGTAVKANGKKLFVPNLLGNTVSVIRTSDNTVVATIPIPGGSATVTPPTSLPSPTGVAVFSPADDEFDDGGFVYVTNAYDNNLPPTTPPFQLCTVSVIQHNQVVATIPAGGFLANYVAFTLDGTTAYVTNGGTDNFPDNRIGVINTGTQTLVSTITETAAGAGPSEVDLNPFGSLAYVPNFGLPSNAGGESIATINTSTSTIINYFTLPVGSFPVSIAVVQK